LDGKKNNAPKLGHWYSAAISRSWKRNPKTTAKKTNLNNAFVLRVCFCANIVVVVVVVVVIISFCDASF